MTPRDAMARAMFGHFFGGTSDPALTDMAESMAASLADQALAALRDAGFAVLTEAKVAARDAAAAMTEREACAAIHSEAAEHDARGLEYSDLVGIPISNAEEVRERVSWHEFYAAVIRARPAPAGAAALAAMLREARREGIEAAAQAVELLVSSWSIAASDECAAAIRALMEKPDA